MAVLYGPYQSSMKNKDGKKLFYPRVVRTVMWASPKSLRDSGYSSLSSGDVKNCIDNLVPS